MTTSPSATSADFRCRRCGACCRWPGCVKLAPGEPERIADALGLAAEEFYEKFTRLAPDRSCLSLIEDRSGHCVFLGEDGDGLSLCRIEAVKPRQCRDFPLRWNFPGWEKLCSGRTSASADADRDAIGGVARGCLAGRPTYDPGRTSASAVAPTAASGKKQVK